MTDANRPTETISPDRLRELIEVYNLQCFRGDTALALEELQRLRHYVATCGGTDNDGRCPMHHLAGVSKDTSEDDAFCGDCGEKLEAVRPGKHQHIGPCPSPGAPGDPPERLLRVMLAHAYSGANLYGDDGELQDNSAQPFIDYLRDDPWQIQHAIHKRGMQKLEAAAKSPGEPRVKHFAQAPHVAIPAGGPRPMTSRANAYVKGIREGVDPVELVRGMLNYQIWLEGQHIQALERLSGEPRDEPLPPCSTCGGETVPFCTSCGYTTTKPAEYPAYTECQHDHMKPNPTLRATYPKHGSQSGWVQEYRCNVCQCSFERPIATAGLRANGETP